MGIFPTKGVLHMRVAVVINAQGRTGSVFEDRAVNVYEKACGGWKPVSQYVNPVPAAQEDGVEQAAEHFAQTLAAAGCTVLVAKTSGAVFRAMERNGLCMFPCTGIYRETPEQFLGSVLETLKEMAAANRIHAEQPDPLDLFLPCDGEPNTYEINLIDAMSRLPELNTREIIFPFFEKVWFERFYMLCEHPPRWLEDTIPVLGYTAAVQRTEDGAAFEIRIDNPMGMNEIKKSLNCGGCSCGG